ncbi:MAG: ferrochelatase [Thermoplasmata archaeon]
MVDDSAPLGVLLMGYGSPSGPEDLPSYLGEVLHGKAPSEEMVAEYVRRYEIIGGSPQNRVLASVRDQLERRIQRERPGSHVYLAMKHWKPWLRDVIPAAARDGFPDLVAVPLSPYNSIWIMEPYRSGVAEGIRASSKPVTVDIRAGWNLEPSWIGYWAEEIRRSLAPVRDPRAAVILSAHSLPKRFEDRGDPYPGLVRATAEAVAAAAGLERWSFAFQSPGNTTEPWLGPDIVDVMNGWNEKGSRTELVASTGFVFDHLETLYDLDVVVKKAAVDRGIDYRRVPQPNDRPEVVEALARRVLAPAPAK